MSLTVTVRNPRAENFGGGFATSLILHAAIATALIAGAVLTHYFNPSFGGPTAEQGSIQLQAVDTIPLPPKAPAQEKQVLVQPDVTKAPEHTEKVATQPPPPPDSVSLKAKTTPKTAPTPPVVANPHPQPTPPKPTKATSGSSATQIQQALVQGHSGSAAMTVQDHVFGQRYAYYFDAVQRIINQNWIATGVDPSQAGKTVQIIFDINADGVPENIKVETPSGSQALDTSVLRALQRVDSFGPLPAGNRQTVHDLFTYQPK